jgi:hypothetical protein
MHIGYDGSTECMTLPSKSKPSALRSTKKDQATFSEVVQLITASREKTLQAVNTALIDLYWNHSVPLETSLVHCQR